MQEPYTLGVWHGGISSKHPSLDDSKVPWHERQRLFSPEQGKACDPRAGVDAKNEAHKLNHLKSAVMDTSLLLKHIW
jgi:hypothetical protein